MEPERGGGCPLGLLSDPVDNGTPEKPPSTPPDSSKKPPSTPPDSSPSVGKTPLSSRERKDARGTQQGRSFLSSVSPVSDRKPRAACSALPVLPSFPRVGSKSPAQREKAGGGEEWESSTADVCNEECREDQSGVVQAGFLGSSYVKSPAKAYIDRVAALPCDIRWNVGDDHARWTTAASLSAVALPGVVEGAGIANAASVLSTGTCDSAAGGEKSVIVEDDPDEDSNELKRCQVSSASKTEESSAMICRERPVIQENRGENRVGRSRVLKGEPQACHNELTIDDDGHEIKDEKNVILGNLALSDADSGHDNSSNRRKGRRQGGQLLNAISLRLKKSVMTAVPSEEKSLSGQALVEEKDVSIHEESNSGQPNVSPSLSSTPSSKEVTGDENSSENGLEVLNSCLEESSTEETMLTRGKNTVAALRLRAVAVKLEKADDSLVSYTCIGSSSETSTRGDDPKEESASQPSWSEVSESQDASVDLTPPFKRSRRLSRRSSAGMSGNASDYGELAWEAEEKFTGKRARRRRRRRAPKSKLPPSGSEKTSVDKYASRRGRRPANSSAINDASVMDPVTGKRMFPCPQCKKLFTRVEGVKIHLRIHTGEKPYSCEICGKRFHESGGLRHHRNVHIGAKPHPCPYCEKRFTSNYGLHRHVRMHRGDDTYICSECGKTFGEASSLKVHRRIHSGDHPYRCDLCDKTFCQLGNYQSHMRIHTGERPYSCSVCGKSFRQSNVLQKHVRIHSGERPFSCKRCGKAFNDSGHLQRHWRTHTGERPYQCTLCAKRFAQGAQIHRCETPDGRLFHEAGNGPFVFVGSRANRNGMLLTSLHLPNTDLKQESRSSPRSSPDQLPELERKFESGIPDSDVFISASQVAELDPQTSAEILRNGIFTPASTVPGFDERLDSEDWDGEASTADSYAGSTDADGEDFDSALIGQATDSVGDEEDVACATNEDDDDESSMDVDVTTAIEDEDNSETSMREKIITEPEEGEATDTTEGSVMTGEDSGTDGGVQGGVGSFTSKLARAVPKRRSMDSVGVPAFTDIQWQKQDPSNVSSDNDLSVI